ncbi:MAG: hypothetical protein HFG27_05130 [Provencibacterium sp.]|nr:hypothetical protein [Provencibacterium sp.]
MKKISAIFLAGLLLFSGCSFPAATTADLMRAPKLTEEQAAVNRALSSALGTEDYKLKYPLSGSYRSAYVFYDVDGDAVQEALVFYQPSVEGSGVRINILDYQNGEWRSIYDISGEGSGDVDYITFESMESKDYKNIIIGWRPENSVEKLMAIYTFEDNRLITRFDERYSQFIIRDFDQDGLMDIVTLSLRRNMMTLVSAGQSGEIETTDTLDLGQNIKSIEQMLLGRLSGSRQAIFLDVMLERSSYATEIIEIEDGRLTPLIDLSRVYDGEGGDPSPQQEENFILTRRYEPIVCMDSNGDGIIEVPSSQPLLGYEEAYNDLEENVMYLTTFSILQQDALTPVFQACVNIEAGYFIKILPRWENRLTVVSDGNPNQWQFIEYRENLNDLSNELLRITRVSRGDTLDRFERNQILLGTSRGLYRFYGYIPPVQENGLQPTEAELKEMFFLL